MSFRTLRTIYGFIFLKDNELSMLLDSFRNFSLIVKIKSRIGKINSGICHIGEKIKDNSKNKLLKVFYYLCGINIWMAVWIIFNTGCKLKKLCSKWMHFYITGNNRSVSSETCTSNIPVWDQRSAEIMKCE